MARSIFMALVLAMCTVSAATQVGAGTAEPSASGSNTVLANGIIVRLKPGVGDVIHLVLDLIETLVPASEIIILDSFDGRYWIQIPPGPIVDEVLELLTGDLAAGIVAYASPNYVNRHPEGENANSFAWGGEDECPFSGPGAWQDQPAWQAMAFEQAHQISTGEDVVVAVIDSGVWHDHPVMQGRIHPASADLLDDGEADGEALAHGTHVAGIVALAAPDASILDLRVLDEDGIGHDFYTAKAVWMAVNAGAQVINLSLGSKARQPPILEDVFDYAAEHGVLIAGAAGNLGEGIDLEPGERQYPAAEQCALGVAAVDSEFELADFSNSGAWVSFSAPGEMIYSTLHQDSGGGSWGCWKGTSMATPFVSATAALMRGANPAVTAPEIAAYLAHTATPSGSDETGYGLISPTEAVTRAASFQAVPVFSPMNECAAYHVQPDEPDPAPPVSGSDDASEHRAAGIELSADIAVLELLDDGLAVGPVPVLETSGSLPFAHRESLLELDIDSPLSLIRLSTGPLGLDALFGGSPGPSATAAGVADLALAVRLLDILDLGDLLELSLTADAVESSAIIEGTCGDLMPRGETHIANGELTAALLGAIGVPLPIEAAPPPNTGIDLDVLGLLGSTLYLNEQIVGGDGVMESSIQVNALRLALDVEIEIIVPVATVNLELIVGQANASRNCNTVDLDVTLSADPDPGMQGGELTYTASATNAGSEIARGTRAIFTRPDATEFISADAPGGCVQTRFNEMTCVLGDMDPAATAEATITVTPHLPGELLSRVQVDSAELESDPDSNSMELITTIQGSELFNSIFSDRFEQTE